MIAAISADIAYGSTSRTNLDKSLSTDRSPASLTVHTPVSYACLKFKRKFETTCGPARDAKGERLWKKDGRGSVSDPQDYGNMRKCSDLRRARAGEIKAGLQDDDSEKLHRRLTICHAIAFALAADFSSAPAERPFRVPRTTSGTAIV